MTTTDHVEEAIRTAATNIADALMNRANELGYAMCAKIGDSHVYVNSVQAVVMREGVNRTEIVAIGAQLRPPIEDILTFLEAVTALWTWQKNPNYP